MIFPEGVSVRLLEPTEEKKPVAAAREPPMPQPSVEPASVSTDAEAGLRSEAGEIEKQARQSRKPEEGENLLKPQGTDNPD
jgi:hypothetical protein